MCSPYTKVSLSHPCFLTAEEPQESAVWPQPANCHQGLVWSLCPFHRGWCHILWEQQLGHSLRRETPGMAEFACRTPLESVQATMIYLPKCWENTFQMQKSPCTELAIETEDYPSQNAQRGVYLIPAWCVKREGAYPRSHDYLEVQFLAHTPGECTRDESQKTSNTTHLNMPLGLSWHCFALLPAEKTQRATTETSEQDLSQGAPLLLEESLHGPQAVRPASSPSLLLVSFLLAAFAHLLSSICLPKLHLLQEALMHLSTLHLF